MVQRHIRWLYGELPALIQQDILTVEVAERIRGHYGPAKGLSTARLVVVLFSILGSALIGSGIILLLAHNWEGLGRPVRAVLSFLPMVGGQALVGWTLWRKRDSMPWCEASSIFLALSIGASIALIGQTYHIPGNLANFLFAWLFLVLPLIYLLRSATTLVFYLIGAVAWAIAARDQGAHAAWYWIFLAAAIPALAWLQKQHRDKPRTALVLWVLTLTLCVSMGVTLDKALPGLWIVVYTALFAAFCLLGNARFYDTPGRPLSVVGSVGTVVLSLMLTYDEWWRRIGFSHYRSGNSRYMEWLGIQDYVLVLGLLALVVVLLVRAMAAKDYLAPVWAAPPIIAVVCYGVLSVGMSAVWPMVAFNGYLFILGISLLVAGVRRGRLGLANGGMGVLAVIFTLRFFDSDLSIVMRGVAFILMGVGFLAANLWLARKRANSPVEA